MPYKVDWKSQTYLVTEFVLGWFAQFDAPEGDCWEVFLRSSGAQLMFTLVRDVLADCLYHGVRLSTERFAVPVVLILDTYTNNELNVVTLHKSTSGFTAKTWNSLLKQRGTNLDGLSK